MSDQNTPQSIGFRIYIVLFILGAAIGMVASAFALFDSDRQNVLPKAVMSLTLGIGGLYAGVKSLQGDLWAMRMAQVLLVIDAAIMIVTAIVKAPQHEMSAGTAVLVVAMIILVYGGYKALGFGLIKRERARLERIIA